MGAPVQPVQPPGQGAGGPPANPVGQAVSQAPPQMAQAVNQLKTGVQSIAAFTKFVETISPEAAKDFKQALQLIASGVGKLRGGAQGGAGVGPGAAPGGVMPPAPQTETPEAT